MKNMKNAESEYFVVKLKIYFKLKLKIYFLYVIFLTF